MKSEREKIVHLLRRFGLESTVRASLAPYNTYEDLDALTAALHRLQAGR